ncbi:ATP-dependent helicase [Slackia isoflavoniconvertens]|uniref:ATP-dependent helicase n=1 Tax=Slackia isoflavoniconvertens TaxID=572010 RepID=UPI003FD8EB4F
MENEQTYFTNIQKATGLATPEETQLNAAQLEAVTTTEGFVRVIAGAGTGKTRALTHRFAYLVNDLGILPGNILCVTFSNKAANEMRQRIRRVTGDNDTGYICTFHSFCVSVLQEDSHAVGYPQSFLVLDNADIDAMLQVIYDERKITLREKTFSKARDMIEILKTIERPDYYLDLISLPLAELKQKYLDARKVDDIIFYGYLYQQKKCFGLDYNDLIIITLHIFDHFPDIALKWQQRLEYVMIDEFQDIDALQIALMEKLVEYHRNLFVVGDPDQTIYTWRGADVRYLLDFADAHEGCKTILMTENYRSTPEVLGVANSLIEKNKQRIPKRLEAQRDVHGPTVWHHAKSPEEEAAWIAEGAQKLHEAGVAYHDMAVLYRAHYASRAVEEALMQVKVPYTLYSGVPFFGRREVKDALSYLRFVAYQDDLSFARVANVPKRNMGQRRMAFLREWADGHECTLYEALEQTIDDEIFKRTKAKQLLALVERFRGQFEGRAVSDVMAAVLNESGYDRMLRTEGSQERLDNVAELKQSIYEFETTCGEEVTLEHYLSHVALLTNADAMDGAADKVKLMTIHAAKGLEFKHVFLCSMSEGVLPSKKTRTREQMEEERRLAFVAMTRAEDGLYLTEAEGFTHKGTPRYPSRFLLDIDPKCLMFSHKPDQTALEAARAAYAANDQWIAGMSADVRFRQGSRVRHAVFGEGIVEEIDMQKRAYIVRFDGLDTTRAISFRVKLEEA